MFKKCAALMLLLLVFNLTGGRIVFAQETDSEAARDAQKVKEKVAKFGKNEKIVVHRRDKTKITGYLTAIEADSFTITEKNSGAATRFSYTDVKKVSSSGASKALTIGVIGGLAAVATIVLVIFGKRYCNEQSC